MNKKSLLWILLDLVFVIVFNVIFFMFGGMNRPSSDWISYGFIMFAYLMVVVTPFMIRNSKQSVLGLSLYSISSTYFLIEFVAGLIFIFTKPESFKVVFAVQLVLAGAYLIILISNLIANESTIDKMERQEEEVAYIRDSASRVKILKGKLEDKKADRAISQVYDILHASSTKSNASVYDLENSINLCIGDLENAVRNNETDAVFKLASDITVLIEERNRRLKLSN